MPEHKNLVPRISTRNHHKSVLLLINVLMHIHNYTVLHCSRLMDDVYPSLHPLFAADPLLLHVFIYICGNEELLSLFSMIPAYLSLTRLSQMSRPHFNEVSTYSVVDSSDKHQNTRFTLID